MLKNISIVTLAIAYIEAHLTEKLDLRSVAQAVHYSKYHLHRIFTDTVGITIHDYVQRRQLTEAAKLLVFSDQPILSIAFKAGYRSQQAFTVIFKSMYKKSPHQYREDNVFYPLQLQYILQETAAEKRGKSDWERNIILASSCDIPRWMALVRLVIDGFPYLNEAEYGAQLEICIREKRALMMEENGLAIGAMIFRSETGSIDFFGIHPQYKKCGIAEAFLRKVFDVFLHEQEISITTFREGDKADLGYRALYQSLGFAEAELLMEFGYPTQKFTLMTPRATDDCHEE